MSHQKGTTQTGASPSGYHFVQSYQNCKRKFYWQYIRSLEPIHKAPALLLGSAGHEGLDEWYNQHSIGSSVSKRVKFATDRAIACIEESYDHYYDKSKFEAHKRQLRDTFQQYGLEYYDESLRVLSREDTLSVGLEYGDIFTGRMDLVALFGDGRRMIVDHKFTGWHMESFARSVKSSDQATAYTMLWNENFPGKRVGGVVFNIIRNYQGKIDFKRVPVYRAQGDVDEFKREVSENFRDLAQRAVDPEATWPKNTDHCFAYNSPCPFLDLCQGVKYDGLVGVKFKLREEA